MKCELLLAQPSTYYQVVSFAKLHEQKAITVQNSVKTTPSRGINSSIMQRFPGNSSTYFLPNNRASPVSSGNFKNPQVGNSRGAKQLPSNSNQASSVGSSNGHIKKMSPAELRARREKGLCYYCDEKYQPNHRCKTSCFLLVGHEEIEELLHDQENEEIIASAEEDSHIQSFELHLKLA